MKNFSWKYLIIVLLAIPIVKYAASNLGTNAALQANESEKIHKAQTADVPQVKAVVSIQDTQGVKQKDFDMNFLNNMEGYTAERIKVNVKKSLESKGLPVGELNIKSESNYIETGGKKFAVLRHKGPGKTMTVMVLTAVGSEMKRVSCFSETEESIPITYGVCGDKIKEVFGMSIGS